MVGDAFRRNRKWKYIGRHEKRSASETVHYMYTKFTVSNLDDISSGLAALEQNYNYFRFSLPVSDNQK